jgi:hypothetical protein
MDFKPPALKVGHHAAADRLNWPRRVTGTSNRDSLKWLACRIRCTILAMRATRSSEASTPKTGMGDSAMTAASKQFHRPIRKHREVHRLRVVRGAVLV